jgi:hypothetical protein
MAITLTEREQKLIDAVAGREKWQTFSASRLSDAEFDLSVDGVHTQFGDSPCKFTAKLMWAALHCCCNWSAPNVAGMTDYPDMAMDGDWSAVRDSSDDAKWRIFDAFVRPNIESIAAVEKVRRKMRKS